MKLNVRKLVSAMVLGVCVYFAYAIWSGLGKMGEALAHFHAAAFLAACTLAFVNYVIRFLKWEFYLSRLDIRGVKKVDSFLTFLSGFVLTVTPGKVGEVFKSLVLFETHGVPMTKTAPIVVAERATDVIGVVVLIVIGSLGFSGGLVWAGVGAALVLGLLFVIANRRLSMNIIALSARLPGRFGRMGPKLEAAYDSLAHLLKPQNLLVPSALSTCAWMLECLALWIILRGFGESTSVPLAMFFYATSTLIGAIIPVPGGLGITESSLMAQMTELGHTEKSVATAAMILVRFATLWFAVVVGFIALSLMKRRYPNLLRGDADAPQQAVAQLGPTSSEPPASASIESVHAPPTRTEGGGR